VLKTLTSASGQRTYDHAIRECGDPGKSAFVSRWARRRLA
jgi:hypothetical protein